MTHSHAYGVFLSPALIVLVFCLVVFPAPSSPGESLPTKNLSKEQPESVPPAPEEKQDVLLPPGGAVGTEEGQADGSKLGQDNLTEDKDVGLMDTPDDGAHTEGKEILVQENHT